MADFARFVEGAITRSQNTTSRFMRDFTERLRAAHNDNNWNLARRLVDEVEGRLDEISIEIATQAGVAMLLHQIVIKLDQLEDAIKNVEKPRPFIGFGLPFTIDKEGKLMAYELPSDQIALFPLLVNGAAPPAGDTFSVVSNNTDQFTAEMDVMPPEAARDAGNPAVKVTPLRHDGMAGVSFTVNDSAGDTAATETFDIIAPKAPPPPAGVISIDDAGVATRANPNPPAA